jgi:galactokinase
MIDLFIPGRLCLFGEHSDWAGAWRAHSQDIERGEAIVTGIPLGLYATAGRDELFHLENSDGSRFQSPMSEVLDEVAAQGGFDSYAAGTAAYMREKYPWIAGASIHIRQQTLPVKRGLSSSAAVCLLVARAFNRLYSLNMNLEDEMLAAYRGERRTPSLCGRMDQALAHGVRPVHMVFDGACVETHALAIGADFHIVMANLMSAKDTVLILETLQRAYPRPEGELQAALHRALGEDNHRIVRRARTLMEVGDARALGELMNEAQALFDEKVAPLCPEELTAPALHAALNDGEIKKWIYGGKGVGSGGDGSVQFVARDEVCQRQLAQYLRQARGMEVFELTLPRAVRIDLDAPA